VKLMKMETNGIEMRTVVTASLNAIQLLSSKMRQIRCVEENACEESTLTLKIQLIAYPVRMFSHIVLSAVMLEM